MSRKRTNRGFTLVELAMVMLIFGMILSTALLAFKLYYLTSAADQTHNAIERVRTVTNAYQQTHGRFPCPARPDLAPDDPNYGREDCGNARRVEAIGRDADEDGNDDFILIGAVPYATILDPDLSVGILTSEFDEVDSFDGWGNKLTYAVTELLTNDTSFNENFGAIDVQDEHGVSVLEIPQTAHTVIISHGPNGVGAYNANGNLVQNCALGITADADNDGHPDGPAQNTKNPDETENCDENDAWFLSGLQSDSDASYNDDILTFNILKNSSIWATKNLIYNDNGTPGDPSDDIKIPQIANTNEGNIGIGIKNPDQKLDVAGDIQAMSIMADGYCDTAGDDCFTADSIAGSGIHCGPGEVVTGIEENDVRCAPAFPGVVTGSCPVGEYMVGLSNINGVICAPL